jgi:hypothetical protein
VHNALGIRQRGLYCCKDTFVSSALKAGVRIERLEEQVGVSYAVLRKHYARWLYEDERDDELRVLAKAADPRLLGAGLSPQIVPPTAKSLKDRVVPGGIEHR